jgi:hypothetical protein
MSVAIAGGIGSALYGAGAGLGLGLINQGKKNNNFDIGIDKIGSSNGNGNGWKTAANILFPGASLIGKAINTHKGQEAVKEQENNNKNNDDEDDQKEPWITLPNIQDKTENNLSYNVGSTMTTADYMKWAEEQQKKLWEREDQIRRETQAREDTAYQRAVEDAKKSGINVAAMGNINPAQSGGGITQATGIDQGVITQSMSNDIQKLIKNITNNFEGNENEKDRLQSMLSAGIGALIVGFLKNAK